MFEFFVNPSRPIKKNGVTADDLLKWYPKERKDQPPKGTFELGLVLAGAVSAGAYTAGVMDFLFEALDRWHEAKANGQDVPRHNVVLRTIAGASAGGINGAIAAAACRYRFPPVTRGSDSATARQNPFYNAWVSMVRIEDFLDTSDLTPGSAVKSILNCAALETIAETAVNFRSDRAEAAMRAWLPAHYRLSLTVTDLSGVPYAVRFAGAGKLYHEMVMHREQVDFEVPVFEDFEPDEAPPDVIHLSHQNDHADLAWRSLGQTALATGAFPMALQAREIWRQPTDYEYRFVYVNSDKETIHSDPWPDNRPELHKFVAVDGGTMNNEPFDLAHDVLAGREGTNPRKGVDATRAIVMVDPFTDAKAKTGDVSPSIPSVAARLLSAFKDQTRFKQIDLSLAEAKDVYSRFLIAPSRGDLQGSAALASGGLSGFLGFFAEAFRHYDFILGRANCQRFLRDWFVLPSSNQLFQDGRWSDAALANPHYRSQSKERKDHLQIIPLVDGLHENVEREAWPKGAFAGYSAVQSQVEARVDAAYKSLVRMVLERTGNPLYKLGIRVYIWAGWKVIRPKLIDMIRKALDDGAKSVDDRQV